MATTRIISVLLCALTLYSHRVSGSDLLKIAESQLGVREKTGHNDGAQVEAYLSYVHLKKGNPWCAAFLSWVFYQAGYPKPRSGWSPDLLPPSRRTTSPLPADVLGIYFPDLQRIAHVGLVLSTHHDWVSSIEGNTNGDGSREGYGVFKRLRHKRFIYAYAKWTASGKGLRP
jgi:hypothetical protein